MKHSDLIQVSIFLYSIVLIVISVLSGDSIDANILKWVSGATSFLVFVWFLYDRWIWKWTLFSKIAHHYFQVPIMHGTWKGKLYYESDKDEKQGNVDIYVCIDQTLTSIHIRSFFEKPSESNSIATKIVKSYQNKLQLYYLYKSEAPHGKRDDNRPHDGVVVLNIIGEPVRELSGSYFTDRRGAGQVRLSQYKSKISETIEEAKQLFGSYQNEINKN